jgi:hypothetical protein
MQEQFQVSEVAGVQVITDRADSLDRLRSLRSAIQSSDKRRTVLVRRLSDEDKKEDIIAAFEITLPIVDEYVLVYRAEEKEPDSDYEARLEIEQDDPKDSPRRVLPSYLHIDVPYTYMETTSAALRTAWRAVQPGDRLIVLTPNADRALTTLRAISQSVPHDARKDKPSLYDQDPSSGSF